MRNGIAALWWYGIALVVILLDQYTKGLASSSLDYGRPQEVFSWFNLTLAHNPGAAFSFLADASGWQRYFFTILASIISAGLVIWLYLMPRGQRLLALSLGLILGGALGNLWDRVQLGYVVDFISVHYGGYYFPSFNIADSAISVGAALMLLDSFIHRDAVNSEAQRTKQQGDPAGKQGRGAQK
ncbi:MAG: signal peptidase II [Halioglobus sp.]